MFIYNVFIPIFTYSVDWPSIIIHN